MSVDTRTPRPGFDDQPALSMVKVDSDPAQVIVNHASFRVHFPPKAQPRRPLKDPARVPAGAARRRAPVVWSGRAAPGATGLLQAVRGLDATAAEGTSLDVGATQVIPRIDEDTMPTPVVVAPRAPLGDSGGADTALLQAVRQSPPGYGQGAYGDDEFDEFERGYEGDGSDGPDGPESRGQRHGADQVRHAYYPGRRMNLGVVLLPLRVFLGFISVYAGMGKLCDPVYFDGGERGSMMKWLNSLHPWGLAEPLRSFALQHPVGAGLSVAFLQIVVGVLTMLGLWQRVAAVFGALLSAALLVTVSWQTVPAYDAPDFIYLAAWSPLITAGAPVYSLDARLSGEAWRRLGPRSTLWELRRRVLRRGTVMATVVVGLTLLIGSLLGGAVRSTEMVTVPGPHSDPTNYLPGTPLAPAPHAPAVRRPSPKPSVSGSAKPSAKASKKARSKSVRESGTVGGVPSQTSQGTTGHKPSTSRHQAPVAPSTTSAGPTSTGGASTPSGSTSGNRNPIGGLLG
ncbi:DoxX family protein [Streptomyces sp. TLI_146]|uniref:DoxX family protein n=1 Tax=Streptomyces sp. TLI_146 TaxID=1938858 RepID=UPI000C70BC70|nr:DoxX family protein [Streptomyces sp. TLI_146]PKV86477.1 putative membrane protein YphA (DoxX/SURF4 family) [Streptomyces sp. TLI_146]